MKTKFWLWGGILSTILLSVIAATALLLRFDELFAYLALPLFLALWGSGKDDALVYAMFGFAGLVTLLSYFIVGALLGYVYGKIYTYIWPIGRRDEQTSA